MTTPESASVTYLLDVNILVALTRADHVHHGRAHTWFAQVDSWATTAVTESSYLRLMLNPKVAGIAYRTGDVLNTLQGLRVLPGHRYISDQSTLAESAVDLISLVGTKQVTDFHLINLAAINDVVLATFDARLPKSLSPADRHNCHVVA